MEFMSKEALTKAFQVIQFTETEESTLGSPEFVNSLGIKLSFTNEGVIGAAKWLRENHKDNEEIQKILEEGAKNLSISEKNEQIGVALVNGVKETMSEGDNFKQWLTCCAKFPKYSFNNSMLIYIQKPDASKVCGYQQWINDFDRHVKKGETGIIIYAPVTKKVVSAVPEVDASGHYIQKEDGTIQTTEKVEKYTSFRAISVFDVSQTEGKELPTICKELEGTVADYKDILRAAELSATVDVKYVLAEQLDGAKGCYIPSKRIINVALGMSEVQTFKTLIHEIAHVRLGHGLEGCELTRNERELQAEAVAFIVCANLGIDTSDYSFEYLSSWSEGRVDRMMDLMSDIQIKAGAIIRDISLNRRPEIRLEYFNQVWETRKDRPLMAVYQLPVEHDFAFCSYSEMENAGYVPSVDDFELKYVVDDVRDKDLELVFMELNSDNRPNADCMRSLSVSDVIVKHNCGTDTAYMVDSFGFKKLESFEETRKLAACR